MVCLNRDIHIVLQEDASGDSPPKRKKTKIDDFFKSDKQKEPEKADVEPACEEEDEEKAGNSSGYVRVTEAGMIKFSSLLFDFLWLPPRLLSLADTSNDEIAKDEQQDEMPSSPTDVKENIRSKFLVDMPEDFYEFWQFAKSLNALSPCGGLPLYFLTSVSRNALNTYISSSPFQMLLESPLVCSWLGHLTFLLGRNLLGRILVGCVTGDIIMTHLSF